MALTKRPTATEDYPHRVSFGVDRELYWKLTEAAARERRSVSDFIRNALEYVLAQMGEPAEPAPVRYEPVEDDAEDDDTDLFEDDERED